MKKPDAADWIERYRDLWDAALTRLEAQLAHAPRPGKEPS